MLKEHSHAKSITDDDDDYFARPYHNSTLQSIVSIRVTPSEDFIVTWTVLWSGFVLTSILAAYQVWKDNKNIASRTAEDIEHGRGGSPGDEGVSSADLTRSMVRFGLLRSIMPWGVGIRLD